MPLDKTDRKLLDTLQNDFPLTGKPYRKIASILGVSEEDIILRLKTLKDARIIRRIGAIFDSKKLGYCSTLCAMRVPDDRIDEVVRIVNQYPGVTHNYIRSIQHPVSSIQHPVYNMWFTITARSQQKLSMIMDEIREKSEIQDLIGLPAVRLFKIKVSFSMLDEEVQNQGPSIKYPASSIQNDAHRD
jgi:DNA-binding Lrp family transcriptional regulator